MICYGHEIFNTYYTCNWLHNTSYRMQIFCSTAALWPVMWWGMPCFRRPSHIYCWNFYHDCILYVCRRYKAQYNAWKIVIMFWWQNWSQVLLSYKQSLAGIEVIWILIRYVVHICSLFCDYYWGYIQFKHGCQVLIFCYS